MQQIIQQRSLLYNKELEYQTSITKSNAEACFNPNDPSPPEYQQCCALCQSTQHRCKLRGTTKLKECFYCHIHSKLCTIPEWEKIHRYDNLVWKLNVVQKEVSQTHGKVTYSECIKIYREQLTSAISNKHPTISMTIEEIAIGYVATCYIIRLREERDSNCYAKSSPNRGHQQAMNIIGNLRNIMCEICGNIKPTTQWEEYILDLYVRKQANNDNTFIKLVAAFQEILVTIQ
jgi:hypothetical protein